MAPLPLQSAGARFFKKFGFAFLWAAFFGASFGALVFYRAPRTDEALPWHQRPRAALERVERWFFDWRVRELGERSARSDLVVPVTIDDDTLASARHDYSLAVAALPWPREVLGGITEQLLREGGTLAVLDQPLTELSPRSCGQKASDDEAFRAALDKHPASSLLTFGWKPKATRDPERGLRPYLLFVDKRPSLAEARPSLRRVLAERAPAFAIPEEDGVGVWAGAASEQRAKDLADAWGLKSPRVIRQRTAADGEFEVPEWRLLASLAEVQVGGLNPAKLPRVRTLEPPVALLLTEASLFGAATVVADSDGVVRGYPHLVRFAPGDGPGHILPSAPLAAAMKLAGSRELSYADGRLSIGGKFSIPMDESGYSLLRWDAPEAGRPEKGALKRAVSVWKLLVNLRDHTRGRGIAHHDNELEGKVAIVTDASSRGPGPLSTAIGPVGSGAVMGQALVNILRSEGIRRADPKLDLLLTLALAAVGAVMAMAFSSVFRARAGPLTYTVALLAAGALYLFAARHQFLEEQQWIAVAGPLSAMSATFLAAMGYAAALERRIREFITTALGRTLSPEVERRLESNLALMRPERRPMTVYFSDIEGFTALSEKLPPELVVRVLNEYLTAMTEAVHGCKGQVDKYIGDSVMAFWGAPMRMKAHAAAACECALRMRDVFEKRRAEWEGLVGRKLEFRAGLASGEVVVGDMGSEHKANYTVMGEAVALAARLESLAKGYGALVLVGEATAGAAKRFAFREVDRLRLDGDGPAVRVYELLGRNSQLSPERQRLLEEYRQALQAYQERRFAEALERFDRCATEHGDALSARYAERCKHLFEHSPPQDWDGVYDGPELAAW